MNDETTSLILIVDDNPQNLQLLGNILKKRGYKLAAATNGPQALDFAQKKGPDIILLDVMMPGIDGFETCEKLKNEPSTKNIPVIFLTAKTDAESTALGFEKGAVDFVAKPFNSKELLARVKTHLDLKHATEALRREKEIAEEAKQMAEEATKLKDKFVSLVAHDLKAPFATIIGFLELLYDDHANPLQPEQKKMVEYSLRSGKGLVNMIQKVLEIGRLQTGKVILEKRFFDGHHSASHTVENLKLLAQEKGIVLNNEVPQGTRFYGDVELFGGVIQNLVSNAIKFCNKEDTITLFAPSDLKGSIAVKDTGIGMNEASKSIVFQHEETTTTRGTAGEKGTGLGLPLSQDIMKAHGGTLSVESVQGEGSVFYATLPFVKPTILVVEDEENLRKIFKRYLSKIDVEFIEAGSGTEAVEILKENTPHLISLDIMMPEMDGFQLLEHIRMNPLTREIPIIVITSDSNIDTRDKVFKMGANDFVTKPFQTEELIPRVRRFLC